MRLKNAPVSAWLMVTFLLVTPLSAMKGWMTDFEAAKKKAAAEKKSLYVNFTGSDW